MTLINTNNEVVVGSFSSQVTIEKGLRQVDSLPTDVFKLVLEPIIRGNNV